MKDFQFQDLELISKPLVCLYGSFGLILKIPTDISFYNQTGGYSNYQAHQEGVFVPFGDVNEEFETALYDYFFTDKKYGGTCDNGIDEEDAEIIDSILSRHRFPQLKVDRKKLALSHEAWVHIVIDGLNNRYQRNPTQHDSNLLPAYNFLCDRAILTWSNSD